MASNFDVKLDIFGQQPLMRLYTQLSFCFPLSDSSLDQTITNTLQTGLERLASSSPWLAGQVISEADETGASTRKIKPLDKIPQLVIKDLRNDSSAPTMEGLRKAHFPLGMLHEDVIAARQTVITPTEPEPVFLVQINWIQGGLILTVNGHHAAMDMIGQAEIIRLLSKTCRGQTLTNDEITTMNMARETIIPLLDNYKPGPEIDNVIPKPPSEVKEPQVPAKASWTCFSFSPESLSQLKSDASKTIQGSGFISTDDALTALVWQSVTRVRLTRYSASTKTNLSRAIDARPSIGAPRGYPGLLQTMTYHNSTMQQLVETPLGVIASQLRSELDAEKIRYNTQSSATYLDGLSDKSRFSVVAGIDTATGLMFSSWAKVDCYDQDFGLGLGKPEAVRRPSFVPVEGLMYLMPKRLDGEIAGEFCLRDDDLEKLKEDEEFAKYARYVG